ncbi:hypothetical protein PTKIN_Ptkin14bG0184500 [Pterospermum kingtungense]
MPQPGQQRRNIHGKTVLTILSLQKFHQAWIGEKKLLSLLLRTRSSIKLECVKLVSLSEQQLLDCSSKIGNHGCNGGSQKNAFVYILQNNGLTTEASYPYQAKQGTCDIAKETSRVSGISSFGLVPPYNEEFSLQAVSNQPVVVSIEGTGIEFKHYKSGIFTGVCGTYLNHDVTVVGYGTREDGLYYWLVKNSWGEDWVRMAT